MLRNGLMGWTKLLVAVQNGCRVVGVGDAFLGRHSDRNFVCFRFWHFKRSRFCRAAASCFSADVCRRRCIRRASLPLRRYQVSEGWTAARLKPLCAGLRRVSSEHHVDIWPLQKTPRLDIWCCTARRICKFLRNLPIEQALDSYITASHTSCTPNRDFLLLRPHTVV